MAERLVSGDLQQEDQDVSLRPRRLEDFVGQQNTKENLSISIQAAKMREEALDHVIIYGPPGLGKTALANIIASEMGADIRAAAKTDSIENALDYKAVAKRLIDFVEGSDFFLVETLAERIAEIVLQEFGVTWVKLQLGKPGAVTGSKDVGVIIERGNYS